MPRSRDPEPVLSYDILDGWSLDGEPVTSDVAWARIADAENARVRERIDQLPDGTLTIGPDARPL